MRKCGTKYELVQCYSLKYSVSWLYLYHIRYSKKDTHIQIYTVYRMYFQIYMFLNHTIILPLSYTHKYIFTYPHVNTSLLSLKYKWWVRLSKLLCLTVMKHNGSLSTDLAIQPMSSSKHALTRSCMGVLGREPKSYHPLQDQTGSWYQWHW